MRLWSFIVSTLLLLAAAVSCGKNSPDGIIFGEDEITVGGRTITVELALTVPQKTQGLKYRRRMGEDRGMLFVYDRPSRSPFWMKDTLIPLSIAFIDRSGRIIGITRMEPDDGKKIHPPPGPFLYALEMNQGWFEKNNIGVGEKIIVK